MLDEQQLIDQLRPLGEQGADIVELWLETLDERVAAIDTAAAARDTLALAIAAHTLRGSAMYVGAVRLADSCAEIERQLNRGLTVHAIGPHVRQVEQDADATAAALRLVHVQQRRD